TGKFKTRKEVLKVKGLGPKVFEQCAGFLRVPESKNFLDATAVHPESYDMASKLLSALGYNDADMQAGGIKGLGQKVGDIEKLAEEVGVGVMTLEDIIKELEKPGRDPREDMPKPILHSDVLDLKDLKEGMKLKGTVRNIVDFGAFVDIGVHQDGLVHVSQMSNKFIKHPLEVVKVGDIVDVTVMSVNVQTSKISLTMKELVTKK
ncbi:MAG: S1 RNA-binding domain-containing protein, partial [Niameybacter sp.]